MAATAYEPRQESFLPALTLAGTSYPDVPAEAVLFEVRAVCQLGLPGAGDVVMEGYPETPGLAPWLWDSYVVDRAGGAPPVPSQQARYKGRLVAFGAGVLSTSYQASAVNVRIQRARIDRATGTAAPAADVGRSLRPTVPTNNLAVQLVASEGDVDLVPLTPSPALSGELAVDETTRLVVVMRYPLVGAPLAATTMVVARGIVALWPDPDAESAL